MIFALFDLSPLTNTTITTVLWPRDCVWDYPGEPVPDKTRKVKPIWICWSKR